MMLSNIYFLINECAVFFFTRMTFSEFAAKYGKNETFKTIEKMKDREALFNEYLTDLKKKDKETTKTRHNKVGCWLEGRASRAEYQVQS